VKVLHIGKFFHPHRGGMETFLRDLMLEQQRQGIETSALVHDSERSFRSRESFVAWRDQLLQVTRAARWFTLAFAPVSPGFALQLSRLIRERHPQILHLHLPNPSGFWCLLLPSARRIPWVVHWHADVVASSHKRSLALLYRLYRIPERWLLKRAATVIATSPPYLEASEPLRDFQHKCVVIPLGIEPLPVEGSHGDSTEARRHVQSGEESVPMQAQAALRILAVGRLTYYKGFTVLMRAVAKVPGATLTLVGDGEERQDLLKSAANLGLGDRFTYLGYCGDDDLLQLYKTHDLFCLPSIERTEAFGVVLLEAMRAGLPCLVTDVPGTGMSWVVDAPDAGLAVPAENSATLAKMLNNICSDRAMLAPLQRSSRSRFDALFQISAVARSVTNVYSSIPGQGRQCAR
jgi:glycosyltransferase involved in cell wall biosynthesis